MRNVAIEDIAQHADELVADVKAGHRLTLVRNGEPIAELVPCSEGPTEHERLAAIEKLKRIFAEAKPIGFEWNGRDELYDRD